MRQSLGMQLIIATGMVALTVVTHLLGLSVLIAATHRHSGHLQNDRAFALQMPVLVGVSFGLFLLHGVEIRTYAALYYTRTHFISRPRPMPPLAMAKILVKELANPRGGTVSYARDVFGGERGWCPVGSVSVRGFLFMTNDYGQTGAA